MNRAGMVLVLVLLAVLALELLAMSAFGLARMAQLAARTTHLDAALRTAAEDAAEQAAAAIDVAATLARPVSAAWDVDLDVDSAAYGTASARLRRLSHGFVHVRAIVAHDTHGQASAATLVRLLEPGAVLAAFPAVVSEVDAAASPTVIGASLPSTCEPGPLVAPAMLPPTARRAPTDTLPLGAAIGVSWSEVASLAETDSLPRDTAAAPVLALVRGPNVVDRRFAGILLVDGDLTVLSSGDVRGLVVVRGVLRMAAGAQLRGAARVGLLEAEGGAVAYDRCAIEAALAVRALLRVYRASARWRLPAF